MEKNCNNSSMSPAFILSCPRSGSTLLRYIVDTHPDFCSPPELNLGTLCKVLYQTVYYTKGEVSGAVDKDEKHRVTLAEIRRITSDLMDSYTAGKKKRRWCEKSPLNLDSISVLSDVYPDAKYICLYRNCMDFVYSILESCKLGFWADVLEYVRREPDNLVNAMAEAWADRTEAILEFERKHPSNTFRIKYESLVSDPVETLKPMFEFLEAEWDEIFIDLAFRTKHDEGEGDLKASFTARIHTKSVGKGSILRRDLVGPKTMEKANKLLEELGYLTIGSDWDAAPFPRSSVRQEDTFSNISKIFDEYLPPRLKERESEWEQLKAIFKIVVIGDDGGQWTIDLTAKEPQVRAGDGEADCTIVVSGNDLTDIVNGTLNVGKALYQGRIIVSGNEQLANTLGLILFGD